MNIVFIVIFIISSITLIVFSPQQVLGAMLQGGTKAVALTVRMTVIYAVWLGIAEVMKQTGIDRAIAKILKPINRFLYGKTSPIAENYLAMNMSANMLSMGGIATPMGISAAEELEKNGDNDAIGLLLVITSTSIELLPTTAISLRSAANSISPASIVLPTLISTIISTFLGVVLYKLIGRKKTRKKRS